MASAIAVKGEVKERPTCRQIVKFLVPIPGYSWNAFWWGWNELAYNVIDIQDAWGEKMCKLRCNMFRDCFKDEILIFMSTKDPVEMNAVVTAVLLLPDGSPSNLKAEKYYKILDNSRKSDALRIPYEKDTKWKAYAQRRRGAGDTRDPEHDNNFVIRFTTTIEYLYPPVPKEPLFMKDFSKQAAQERNAVLERLLSSPVFEKVKLVCSDGVEINASKDLLAACCPVFEAMFRSNMQEAVTKVIKVDDVKGSVMKILLDYWQDGKLADSWNQPDIIGDLLLAADKYQVAPLMKFLDSALGNKNVVASNLHLLEIAAKAGYKNAEKIMTQNLVHKVQRTSTRGLFDNALGIDADLLKEKRKGESQLDNQKWRSLVLDMETGWNSENSTLENLHRVSDLGLVKQTEMILTELKDKVRHVRCREELLEAIGLSESTSSYEPARKKFKVNAKDLIVTVSSSSSSSSSE